MIALSLQSGSNGNCTYVEAGGKRLLFDAGICGAQAERRLIRFGRNIREVDAVIISHDHSDHIRYAGVYQRKYGIPLYATSGTLEAALKRYPLGRLRDVNLFFAGGTLRFGRLTIHSIPTMHDGADGSLFVVSCEKKHLGIMTDLGHVFDDLGQTISSLDAVFIESNYDPEMLKRGPYPPSLQQRISGPGGHLSNYEAAILLNKYGKRLKWACLSHLSENNNSPSLAFETHRRMVNRNISLYTASRYVPTGIFTV